MPATENTNIRVTAVVITAVRGSEALFIVREIEWKEVASALERSQHRVATGAPPSWSSLQDVLRHHGAYVWSHRDRAHECYGQPYSGRRAQGLQATINGRPRD